jgi:predicted AAA+ superfamily ATPase
MQYTRPEFKILTKRIREPRKFIQVIAGPRQVGKTTLVGQFLESYRGDSIFVSADAVPAGNSLWIEESWSAARLKLKNTKSKELLLVIDEIQKIDNWSEVVKAQWEKDTRENNNIKLILLGSSRLLLKEGLSESLMGRFELIHMTHWSLPEMEKAFNFDANEFVWYGGYPGAADLRKDEARWKDYVNHALIETSISKDIFLLTRINKPALLKKLFELGCSYSGQILSYTKILGQVQDAGNTTTLAHYLTLLGEAGLLTGLEKYTTSKVATRSSSPKFMVNNTALMSAQSNYSFPEILNSPDIWGRYVESAVGAHLINAAQKAGIEVFYWRDAENEVDFILQRAGEIVAIEVKSGHKKPHNKGLELFVRLHKPTHHYVVGSPGLSWEEFLRIDIGDLF